MEIDITQEMEIKLNPEMEKPSQVIIVQEESQSDSDTITYIDNQDLFEITSIFEASGDVLKMQKSIGSNLNESVIKLSQGNHTINLNNTNDSQNSLEDKLADQSLKICSFFARLRYCTK